MHTLLLPSDRFNSMNQHFWTQNIKIYHKKNAPLLNHLACAKLYSSQPALAKLPKIGSCLADIWLCASKMIWQSGIFYYFYNIFYYLWLKSIGSLSWTYRSVQTRCVWAYNNYEMGVTNHHNFTIKPLLLLASSCSGLQLFELEHTNIILWGKKPLHLCAFTMLATALYRKL